MSHVNDESHPGKMEAVAQANQRHRDDVMADELFEILSGLLQLQHEHDGLLAPKRSLQKVVRLEKGLMIAMRKILEKGGRPDIPDRGLTHDVESQGSQDGGIYGHVHLLQKAGLLGSALNLIMNRQRSEENLHQKLADEREDDNIKGEKSKISRSLSVTLRLTRLPFQGI